MAEPGEAASTPRGTYAGRRLAVTTVIVLGGQKQPSLGLLCLGGQLPGALAAHCGTRAAFVGSLKSRQRG